MKRKLFKLSLSFLFLTILMSACKKETAPSSGGNGGSGGGNGGGGSGKGSVMFWSDFPGSPIAVYISGSYKGQITKYHSSAPSCGTAGAVTIELSAGSYSFSAEDDSGTWSGTITISSGNCLRYRLHE